MTPFRFPTPLFRFLGSPGVAVAEAPPRVRRQLTGIETYRQRRRTLAIRHVSGHRLIALVESVSPANKDRLESVEALAAGSSCAAARPLASWQARPGRPARGGLEPVR